MTAAEAVSQIEKVAVRDEVEDGSGEALTVGVAVSRGVGEATMEMEGDTLAVLVLVGDTVAAAESEAQVEKVGVTAGVRESSGEAVPVSVAVNARESDAEVLGDDDCESMPLAEGESVTAVDPVRLVKAV